MINAILHFIRGKHVKAVALFHKLPGELLDVVIPPKGKWAGKAIKNAKIPDGVTIASVIRNDQILVATGDLTLEEGDRLIVFAPPKAVNKLETLFQK
jgi:trk system potassium uptake protein TrkA